ncbi:hypothetical protein PICSAR120_00398 [Mycobacterium avium subsp. paratuberculosis]|nr:hypothetical protein PICSAR110_00370 [Mycobacterium avium subsp. paratuberculosis]CAG6856640.1 hypothetical protein PICSAR120_00398 [Mycobacterium avium subsp. paratuberculosis]CAG6861162.1 hypothetical protein PICSAR107_00630 [Mycobacterium avium subsp. paratuberculosis]CAG6957673.1 hypothetical protein PICSAR162_00597 [Mycobacterium avium subsp. paratuberculosis]CAG7210183.1 hypothetical protein PICSAR235_04563 [Mycobacterium avium subsp. paratuberculosis]
MPATACQHRRRGPRRPLLRSGDRGGGRPGASRRGAAARAAGAAGARGGPLLRVRGGRGRAAGRRGGRELRGRRRVPGRDRRPVVHRGPGGAGGPDRGAGRRREVPVGAVRPPTRHRAEPVRPRPRRADGPVVADGNSHHRAVRRTGPRRRGVPVRRRRGGRAPAGPRRTRTAALRAGTPGRARGRAGLRPADRPGGRRGVRRALAGRHAASGADGRRCGLHPAGHSRRHRERRRTPPGVAVRRAVDRGRHRRPGALATGRLVEQPHRARSSHRPGDAVAAAGGGGGLRRGAAVAALGRPGGGGPAAGPPGAGAGAGLARPGGGAGAGALWWPRPGRAHHLDPARRRAGAAGRSRPAVARPAARAVTGGVARRSGGIA